MKRYASIFEWPDRERAELGIVEELLATLRARGERQLSAPRMFRPDPPDCTCLNEAGDPVAIEAETLVCLFTDEPVLPIDRIADELRGASFGPFRQITGAFLVVSCDAGTRTFPVHTLRLRRGD